MESNPVEAVRNNALATRVVAHVAGQLGVGRFVLVSTDKAVQPATVMGASKALAEFALEAASARWPGTRYNAVRFGNVLGSSGSVVPIFRRQIARGGPVTVTDERMTRYFMTIPEAVQLIIRSGSLAAGGRRPRGPRRARSTDRPSRPPRRGVRARHGRAGADRRAGARDDRAVRPGPRSRHRDRDRRARGGEKLHEQLFNSYERSRRRSPRRSCSPSASRSVPRRSRRCSPRSDCWCSRAMRRDWRRRCPSCPPPATRPRPGAAADASRASRRTSGRRRGLAPQRRRHRRCRGAPCERGNRRAAAASAGRLRPSYTPGIHDELCSCAIAFGHVHEDRCDRGVRRAGRDCDPCVARLLAGARAQAPARVGRSRAGACRRTGAARNAGAAARVQQASPPVPPVRQVPRATPVIARPAAASAVGAATRVVPGPPGPLGEAAQAVPGTPARLIRPLRARPRLDPRRPAVPLPRAGDRSARSGDTRREPRSHNSGGGWDRLLPRVPRPPALRLRVRLLPVATGAVEPGAGASPSDAGKDPRHRHRPSSVPTSAPGLPPPRLPPPRGGRSSYRDSTCPNAPRCGLHGSHALVGLLAPMPQTGCPRCLPGVAPPPHVLLPPPSRAEASLAGPPARTAAAARTGGALERRVTRPARGDKGPHGGHRPLSGPRATMLIVGGVIVVVVALVLVLSSGGGGKSTPGRAPAKTASSTTRGAHNHKQRALTTAKTPRRRRVPRPRRWRC